MRGWTEKGKKNMDEIRITDDPKEMVSIGRNIVSEIQNVYSDKTLSVICRTIEKYRPKANEREKEDFFFRSIYDFWAYGAETKEWFYYAFDKKSSEEKQHFLTGRNRLLYMYHLNKREDEHLLKDKYEAYQILKDFYKREVVKIREGGNFRDFCGFIKRHKAFVAKPVDLSLGIGVERICADDFDSPKAIFEYLLSQGKVLQKEYAHWNANAAVVLEEEIIEDEAIHRFHPYSVNPVRFTTVRLDDHVVAFYPTIRFGITKDFVASASQGAISAGISENGTIITNAITKVGTKYIQHPMTGLKIQGERIPRWNELVEMLTEAAGRFPTIRYIGWDAVLTPQGWCIMEGNFYGEFTSQIIFGRGLRQEFEDLIGWKPKHDFWWQNEDVFTPDGRIRR